MTIKLTVESRTEKGKHLQKLRAVGRIPAVVYGAKEESELISVDAREFEQLFKKAGESSVVHLAGLKEEKEVLINDVSFDPLKGKILHIDFYTVKKGQKVTVHIPIVFTGEAPAIKLGGSLTKALHELEVTGSPSHLPHEIEVDVSTLKTFEDHIRVKDLSLPKNVVPTNDPEDTVVVVVETKEDTELQPVEPAEVVPDDK